MGNRLPLETNKSPFKLFKFHFVLVIIFRYFPLALLGRNTALSPSRLGRNFLTFANCFGIRLKVKANQSFNMSLYEHFQILKVCPEGIIKVFADDKFKDLVFRRSLDMGNRIREFIKC